MNKLYTANILYKTEPEQEDGWIFKFDPSIPREKIDNIVSSLYEEHDLSCIALGKPVELVVTNNTQMTNEKCFKLINKVIKEIIEK